MEQEILIPFQKQIINLFSRTEKLSDFYLSGGTALAAYYLYHRFSDDLDFFNYKNFDPIFIHSFSKEIQSEIKIKKTVFSRLYDRYQFFYEVDGGEIKVEFTKYPFSQLELPQIINGVKVDSLRDIAANKLAALLDRFDPKDFVDIYFILKFENFTLNQIKNDVEKKFSMEIEPLFLGSEFSKVKRVKSLPKMIKPLTVKELKDFFSKEAQKLSSDIIVD